VWILFAGSFINRFGAFVAPFLVLYLTRRGFSTAQAGLALGAYGVGLFVATFVGGQLADALGRKETIVISMISSAVSMLALSQASAYPLIVFLSFCAGSTAELYRPASAALIVDLVPPELRLTAYATYRLAINLGFAAGPATAGFLADRSWLLLFAGDAITSLLFATIAALALPTGVRAKASEAGWGVALRAVRHDRRFLQFLLAATCVTLVLFQFSSTLPLHVRDAGHSSTTFGLLMSINGILIATTELSLTRITQRWPRYRTIALGWFLIGLGFTFTGMAHSRMALAATVVIWTLGEMISAPMSATNVADAAPPELRGRYMGLYGLTWSVGMTFGPPLGTLLYGHHPSIVWSACGVLGATAAIMVLLIPHETPSTAAESALS
jgi:MFS family permease